MNTRILFSYPLVFHRVRRVDSRYAYLVVRDGFVPLRRREGCFSTILRYEKYGEWKSNYDPTAPSEYFEEVVLSDYDEISSFFQIRLQEESADNYEGFEELGRLWDERFDDLYGDNSDKIAFLEHLLKSCHPIDKTGYETTSRKLREEKRRIQHKQGFFYYDTFDHLLYPVDEECKEPKHVDPCSIVVKLDEDVPICFYDDGQNEPTNPWF